MPGLLRAVAGTAVLAGTAQATRNAVDRRQAQKNMQAYSDAAQNVNAQAAPPPQQVVYAAPPQAYAPPPSPASTDDVISQLERLSALKAQGILTEEEFQAQKAKILGG